eukprot:CAMPEP_0194027394 /NCGR_PEP_ID=MMETSP0009_2-20130614/1548_1 /TAXON_ID=210454 /ORGANISM="Grammatophora oceanica, Strain CCMP 410" /LENGTH=704 /DNA_ID=CAMNT_0038666445 /DNA_START=41 /DNA_END=2155 /DNA_ORIENTATION=+
MEELEAEAAELDGYFSDADLDPQPNYPPLDESFERAVVITNLPKVPESKLEKLTKVIMKLLNRIGKLAVNEETGFTGLFLPTKDSKTLGFAIVEYETVEEAKNAVDVLQDYSFDKNHALSIIPYQRAQYLQDVSVEKFEAPQAPPFAEKPNVTSWLEDPSQRDSFVVRHGKETVIFWSDGKSQPQLDYSGEREKEQGITWCDYYCHWSPKGSYLATLVPSKGVILWSGKDYQKTARFAAPGVDLVLFSPQENYLLTNNNKRNDPAAIKIFHIATGRLLRAFGLFPKDVEPDGNIPPPQFQWSHDDKYVARMGKSLISIFETPSMRLLEKRSLAADGINEFSWSPSANVLAYWAPEVKNSPAHVDLIEIPSRKKLRQKNLFNVTKVSMVWQESGDYLGCKVTRHTKSKKTLYNNIELFRLNEPGVPVEMLDVKDAVMALAFEHKGSRFAMIHAESPSSAKCKVSFYDMRKKVDAQKKKGQKGPPQKQWVNELNLIRTLDGKQCNCLFWSPAGQTIILASLGENASGTLEFYDVETESLAIKEHYRANGVLWDPSGRTVATVVSQPIGGGHFKYAMDNGYVLWTFLGKQVHSSSFESFYQFLWRPRESLLSPGEIKKVRKNLKQYERQFDMQDKERLRALKMEETKGKRAQRTRYRDLVARLRAIRERQKDERIGLMNGYDSDGEGNYIEREVTIETILSSKEEVI